MLDKLKTFFIRLLVAVFMLLTTTFLSHTLLQQHAQLQALEAEYETLSDVAAQYLDDNHFASQRLTLLQHARYFEKEAKHRLGWSKPNELLFEFPPTP